MTISATNSAGTGSATLVITVSNPPLPVISSSLAQSGTVGIAFSYQITASGSPTSFGATGLPGGLGINTSTGAITGTPTSAGVTVNSSASAPVISSSLAQSGTVGTAFNYQITASSSPTSFGATGLPTGLSVNTTNGAISGTPTTAGTSNVTISATNGSGTGTATLVITISPSGGGTSGLIAGWDFQTTTTGGTAISTNSSGSAQLTYVANFGSGTIYLNGLNGSSSWLNATPNPQVTAFAGTTNNAGSGFSTNTTSPACLALANSTANSNKVVFQLSMTGKKDLIISYATRGTASGFTSHIWDYSSNASNWTTFDTITGRNDTNFSTVTLSNVTSLNNLSNAYLRLTLLGATTSSGNNR
ncbi:MAG: hypothetical protein EBY83_08285, partial [Verrucomicrobia bacterium]|nr:hypothetical protein [Verrucomicrobiota bacterium]